MFDNRLANLRKERGLNKKEMAKALNLPYTTYLNYENNEREPNSETLIQISNFLNVSIDYLLGVSNVKSVDINIKQARKTTGLSEQAIKKLQSFCINEPFGMVQLNKLIEQIDIPYTEGQSLLYEIVLYLCYVNSYFDKYGDYFIIKTNNTIQRISRKDNKHPDEISRISENKIIQQIMLNNVIDCLTKKPLQSEYQIAAASGNGVEKGNEIIDEEKLRKEYEEIDD